jgi:hypothetical protein
MTQRIRITPRIVTTCDGRASPNCPRTQTTRTKQSTATAMTISALMTFSTIGLVPRLPRLVRYALARPIGFPSRLASWLQCELPAICVFRATRLDARPSDSPNEKPRSRISPAGRKCDYARLPFLGNCVNPQCRASQPSPFLSASNAEWPIGARSSSHVARTARSASIPAPIRAP